MSNPKCYEFCRDEECRTKQRCEAAPFPCVSASQTIVEQIWTEGVCGDGVAILRDGIPVSVSDLLTRLNEVEPYETPAWKANTRLNARVEICYQALELIRDTYLVNHTSKWAKALAERTLERAANVQ